MAGGVACRGCGVILPGRVARCPACGSLKGLWRGLAWWALAIGAVVGLARLGVFHYSRVDPSLAADVEVVYEMRNFSRDMKRINVSGQVSNKSQVPVDVIVRFKGKDAQGHDISNVATKPYRKLLPGSTTIVNASFEMIPLQEVEVEFVELVPSPK